MGEPGIASPGHVRLSFGIPPEGIRKFEQRIDLVRGSVTLRIEWAEGSIAAETFGVMGQDTLLVQVEDSRPNAAASACFSIWRPKMQVSVREGVIVARQVHDFDERGRRVADPAQVDTADRVFNLGIGVAAALAGSEGLLPQVEASSENVENRSATLRAEASRRYWLVISSATTYDGAPDLAAERLLRNAVSAGKAHLMDDHLAWWRRDV